MPLPTPKVMVLFTSFLCDARCVMCYTWVKAKWEAQLSVKQLDSILSDPLISRSLETVNLTGGEPTLRADLVELVEVLVRRCERLKSIDIPTNGFVTERVVDRIEQVLAFLARSSVELAVTLSIDGVGAIHEQIRGRQGVFDNITRTVEELKELSEIYPRFRLGMNTVISRHNASRKHLEPMREFAASHGIGLNFTIAAVSEVGVESIAQGEPFEILPEQRPEIISFFEQLMEEKAMEPQYGEFITHWLRTGKRNTGCAFRDGKTILVEPNGKVFLCGTFKEFQLGNLLEEGLQEVWPRQRKFTQQQWNNRCETCVSNCYLDP